jgi:lipopolysaccharide export system protein LptC|tara:strand:+ start:19825 stop:20388 length:564 start_codon:yes stop_codon:yes gene_type:complete
MMSKIKTLLVSTIAVATIAAVTIGWFYEPKITVSRSDLEIPTNIDYFLAELQYKSMNEQGNLDFEMQSPYLEHLIASNISLIDQPTIQIYRNLNDWQIESLTGKLFHQQNSLQLAKNVVMHRMGKNPLHVRTEVILFQPDLGLISTSEAIEIKSDTAVIHGSAATFDLKNRVYSLKNTKAIYRHENS